MHINQQIDQAIVEVQGLKKFFPLPKGVFKKSKGVIKAVDGVDLFIPQAKTLGLVGESGCGKSTLSKIILKLLPPDQGKIIFKGQDITLLPEKKFRPLRKKIQVVFQDPYGSLNPRLTIRSTLKDACRIAHIPKETWEKKMRSWLDMVGLDASSLDKHPHEFSGGQRQRICIARALSVQPELIICDEPISALDVSIQAQVINLLKELQTKFKISYLFISHDLNMVGYLSHWIAVMYLGQIVEYGPSEDLLTIPAHPYTRTLLAATPIPDPKQRKMRPPAPSKEELPDKTNSQGQGCRFAPRCPLSTAKCRQEEPQQQKLTQSHWTLCHFPGQQRISGHSSQG